MPCRSWEDDLPVEDLAARRKLDEVTRLLCSTMRHLAARGAVGDAVASVPGLGAWWHKHQEEDRKREAYEAAEKQKKRDALQKKMDRLKEEMDKL